MSKKLFVVTTEVEAVVAAENEQEARRVAAHNWQDIAYEVELGSTSSWDARICTVLPFDWNDDCIPWGSSDGKTAGFYMKKIDTQWEEDTLAEKLEDTDNLEIDD